VRGRTYTATTGMGLYPTTGTLSDYAYGRHVADPSLHTTYGYTLETGPQAGNVRDSFHPPDPELIKREVESGLLALAQQCIRLVELVGLRLPGRGTGIHACGTCRYRSDAWSSSCCCRSSSCGGRSGLLAAAWPAASRSGPAPRVLLASPLVRFLPALFVIVATVGLVAPDVMTLAP
jgi:hypothetical protein